MKEIRKKIMNKTSKVTIIINSLYTNFEKPIAEIRKEREVEKQMTE